MPVLSWMNAFAARPTDSDEVRLEKKAVFVVASACSLAGLAWSLMYLVVFGPGLTAGLPLAFTVVVGSALALSHATGNHRYAVYAQIVCIIQITAFIQWSIGGAFDSGFVLIWAILGPITALVFFPPRSAIGWLALYLVNVAITVAFDTTFAAHGERVSDEVRLVFVVMNLTVASVVVFAFALYFVDRARDQRRRADKLLLNILPAEVAPRLKKGETIADAYDSASVLFADMVGSTATFADMPPNEVVEWLDRAFTAFDHLTVEHGVEKIRTIGDNYMVAAGIPTERSDHAEALIAFAVDMLAAIDALPPRRGARMQFRVGIHSGAMTAGVLGEVKFQYDLWGDTVNIAARMESSGEVGRIQVSEATYALAKHAFDFEPRGTTELKGRGEMKTWFVVPPGR